MDRKKLLGRHFSEGARRLWLTLRKRAWSQKDLAAALGKHNSGLVNRWLYGDRVPNRESALLIYRVLRIPPALWGQHPSRPFTLPTVQATRGTP